MFAVPGWSVSSTELKTQTKPETPKPTITEANKNSEGGISKASKKRKRGQGATGGVNVTDKNIGELWDQVIEGKVPEKANKPSQPKNATPQTHEIGGEEKTNKRKKLDKLKGKKQEKKNKAQHEKNVQEAQSETLHPPSSASSGPTPAAQPVAPPAPNVKLTPLQAKMREKLISARFRYLNETLYTTPSANALDVFSQNPEMFNEYHEGFRKQVEVWPENPVDGYIETLKTRGAIKFHGGKGRDKHHGGRGGSSKDVAGAVQSLPRTDGICRVADLGCGDARLAQMFTSDKAAAKKLKLEISSFDLQSPSPLVTKADMANLPLKDGSVNVAIFCLALMGTNWIDFVEEAYRILHWRGELWVAEIKSRFGRVGKAGRVVEHSVGHRQKKQAAGKQKNKKGNAAEGDDIDPETEREAFVEIDGGNLPKQETDVSAFIEVLRKRGFVLQQDSTAVDLSNKMFVKMHFVKAATPVRGKCVPKPGADDAGAQAKKQKPKFIDADALGGPTLDEEKTVLKPCVYKL
ncbi:hypothetical protein L228DRAFT_244198, partial [Xylona heveae TC161]